MAPIVYKLWLPPHYFLGNMRYGILKVGVAFKWTHAHDLYCGQLISHLQLRRLHFYDLQVKVV